MCNITRTHSHTHTQPTKKNNTPSTAALWNLLGIFKRAITRVVHVFKFDSRDDDDADHDDADVDEIMTA